MAWVDLSAAFAYGSKLTSTQMQNLRDNIAALAAGDAGHPEITKDALKTTANTTGVSGAINVGVTIDVDMQDYCFYPHLYSDHGLVQVRGNSDATADTVGMLAFYNDDSSNHNYAAYWRYVTASDEPFVYALVNKATGKIEHLWSGGEPPDAYWGLDEAPADFKAPIRLHPFNPDDYEEIILFKQDAEFLTEINGKARVDKKLPYQVMNDYEFDKSNKLFKKKNIGQI